MLFSKKQHLLKWGPDKMPIPMKVTVGKDNVPFHAIIWPAMLLAYGDLNLPTNVPANQYILIKGEKASASRGVGKTLNDYLDEWNPDSLRYALASILPEQNDSEISEDEMIRRNNEELVAAWGNLVQRVFSQYINNFETYFILSIC